MSFDHIAIIIWSFIRNLIRCCSYYQPNSSWQSRCLWCAFIFHFTFCYSPLFVRRYLCIQYNLLFASLFSVIANTSRCTISVCVCAFIRLNVFIFNIKCVWKIHWTSNIFLWLILLVASLQRQSMRSLCNINEILFG